MRFARWFLVSSTLAILAPHRIRAYPLDPNFTDAYWVEVVGGTATGMAWAPDGSNRLFLAEQNGSVWIVLRGGLPSVRLLETFTTITPILENGESGLIGLAFDPLSGQPLRVLFRHRLSA